MEPAQGQDRSDHRRRGLDRQGRGGGGRRRGRHRGHQRSRRPSGRGACARRHLGARLAARDRRDRPHARPARRPGQRGGPRGARQHRGNRFRHLAARSSPVNLDGTFLGCKHALPLLKRARRRDRQRLVGRGPDRRAQLRRLQRLEGRRAAAEQIGGAARRAARTRRCAAIRSIRPFWKARWSTRCCGRPISPTPRARASRATSRSAGSAPPAEVADMCVYLLSDESRFVTGAEFVIDGGLTAR